MQLLKLVSLFSTISIVLSSPRVLDWFSGKKDLGVSTDASQITKPGSEDPAGIELTEAKKNDAKTTWNELQDGSGVQDSAADEADRIKDDRAGNDNDPKKKVKATALGDRSTNDDKDRQLAIVSSRGSPSLDILTSTDGRIRKNSALVSGPPNITGDGYGGNDDRMTVARKKLPGPIACLRRIGPAMVRTVREHRFGSGAAKYALNNWLQLGGNIVGGKSGGIGECGTVRRDTLPILERLGTSAKELSSSTRRKNNVEEIVRLLDEAVGEDIVENDLRTKITDIYSKLKTNRRFTDFEDSDKIASLLGEALTKSPNDAKLNVRIQKLIANIKQSLKKANLSDLMSNVTTDMGQLVKVCMGGISYQAVRDAALAFGLEAAKQECTHFVENLVDNLNEDPAPAQALGRPQKKVKMPSWLGRLTG